MLSTTGRRVLRARISTKGRRAVSARGGRRVRLVLRRGHRATVRVRIALRLRGGEPLDAWGRRASEEAAVILGTWSFVGRGYSDNDSASMAVTTAARTREYPDAA